MRRSGISPTVTLVLLVLAAPANADRMSGGLTSRGYTAGIINCTTHYWSDGTVTEGCRTSKWCKGTLPNLRACVSYAPWTRGTRTR